MAKPFPAPWRPGTAPRVGLLVSLLAHGAVIAAGLGGRTPGGAPGARSSAAAPAPPGGERLRWVGTADGGFNAAAWQTEAFYGNPLAGFNAAQ